MKTRSQCRVRMNCSITFCIRAICAYRTWQKVMPQRRVGRARHQSIKRSSPHISYVLAVSSSPFTPSHYTPIASAAVGRRLLRRAYCGAKECWRRSTQGTKRTIHAAPWYIKCRLFDLLITDRTYESRMSRAASAPRRSALGPCACQQRARTRNRDRPGLMGAPAGLPPAATGFPGPVGLPAITVMKVAMIVRVTRWSRRPAAVTLAETGAERSDSDLPAACAATRT
jgi:hypothetical protein